MLNTEIIQFYRQLRIWNGYVNHNFCYFAVPPGIFFTISFIVLGTYGTIRMMGKIPWIFYPFIPMATSVTSIFAFTLISYGSMVFESSKDYLVQLRQNVKNKHDRRLVKSLRPVAMSIGPFGQMDKGLCTAVTKYFTECTGNLLITF